MDYTKFLEPKEIEVCGEKYLISQIPAYYAHDFYGAMIESLRDYATIGYMTLPKDTVCAMLGYVAYKTTDGSWESIIGESGMTKAFKKKKAAILTLKELLSYNFDFFFDGSLLGMAMGLPTEE
jgi:hypothetical protein